jgi:membrane protein
MVGYEAGMPVRELAMDVLDSFRRNGLVNFASAMAFRVILALVPLLLFLLALIGFLDLEEIWRSDVAPELKKTASEAAYRLIDDTVEEVVSKRQVWWLTIGFLLTLWELSAATRVAMVAMDRVYGLRRRRGLLELLPRSVALGAVMGVCAIAAIAIVRFGPLVSGDLDGVLAVLSFLIRWLLAACLLAIGVGLMVRFGSATRQPLPWVSLGTGLVLAAWILTSIAFGLYATYIASYGTVFGHLATFFVLLIYVYLIANAFLVGIQLDACVRERA